MPLLFMHVSLICPLCGASLVPFLYKSGKMATKPWSHFTFSFNAPPREKRDDAQPLFSHCREDVMIADHIGFTLTPVQFQSLKWLHQSGTRQFGTPTLKKNLPQLSAFDLRGRRIACLQKAAPLNAITRFTAGTWSDFRFNTTCDNLLRLRLVPRC